MKYLFVLIVTMFLEPSGVASSKFPTPGEILEHLDQAEPRCDRLLKEVRTMLPAEGDRQTGFILQITAGELKDLHEAVALARDGVTRKVERTELLGLFEKVADHLATYRRYFDMLLIEANFRGLIRIDAALLEEVRVFWQDEENICGHIKFLRFTPK